MRAPASILQRALSKYPITRGPSRYRQSTSWGLQDVIWQQRNLRGWEGHLHIGAVRTLERPWGCLPPGAYLNPLPIRLVSSKHDVGTSFNCPVPAMEAVNKQLRCALGRFTRLRVVKARDICLKLSEHRELVTGNSFHTVCVCAMQSITGAPGPVPRITVTLGFAAPPSASATIRCMRCCHSPI